MPKWCWSALLPVVVLALLPLGASAQQSEVIYACIQQGSTQVRIVSSADQCRSPEVPIQWNVVGIQGPPGPQGPAGPLGIPVPASVTVDCGAGQSITQALQNVPGSPLTILVQETCTENVTIKRDDVSLLGNSSATVTAADPSLATLVIEGGRRVVLDGLTVIGGKNGVSARRGATFTLTNSTVQASVGSPARNGNGVEILQSSYGLVDGNVIENHPNYGINLEASSATITGNTIRSNGVNGITVNQSSAARIGITEADTISGNLIEYNGALFDGAGIEITHASVGHLYGNTIQNNANVGVYVVYQSAARLYGGNMLRSNASGIAMRGASLRSRAGNEISGSTYDGIFAEDNSDVDLRDGLQVFNNGVGGDLNIGANGISLRHGARMRAWNIAVSGNYGAGIRLERGSSVWLRTPPVSITGNDGGGLICGDQESSLFPTSGAALGGIIGNTGSQVDCSGF